MLESVYAWSWSCLMRERALRARLLFLQQHRAGIYPQTDVRSPLYSLWHGAQPYLSAQLFTWQSSCSGSFSSSPLSFAPPSPSHPACVFTFTSPHPLPPHSSSLLRSPHCLKSNTPYSCKPWSIKCTNLFSWGDGDILTQAQLQRDEKGQASRTSEYLGPDANLYPTLYI